MISRDGLYGEGQRGQQVDGQPRRGVALGDEACVGDKHAAVDVPGPEVDEHVAQEDEIHGHV